MKQGLMGYNRDFWKERLHLIQAFCEGKEILALNERRSDIKLDCKVGIYSISERYYRPKTDKNKAFPDIPAEFKLENSRWIEGGLRFSDKSSCPYYNINRAGWFPYCRVKLEDIPKIENMEDWEEITD